MCVCNSVVSLSDISESNTISSHLKENPENMSISVTLAQVSTISFAVSGSQLSKTFASLS